jgi:hypothetical protein
MFAKGSIWLLLPRFATDSWGVLGQPLDVLDFVSSDLSDRAPVGAINPGLSSGYGFPGCLVALAIGIAGVLEIAQYLLVLR